MLDNVYLLRAIYFLVGLLIYIVPGFVFWGYSLSTIPHYPNYYSNSVEVVLVFHFFIALVLAFPMITFRIAPAITNPLIPIGLATYFVVAYGLLLFFYRRKSQGAHAKWTCRQS